MLNADLLLKNESRCKKISKRSCSVDDDTAAGFHFIAFMPIGGCLWKLDGLERQPMLLGNYPYLFLDHACAEQICIGPVKNDWLAQASPDIQARMAQYEENRIEFAILSLVRDPLIELLSDLAENVNDIKAVESHLDEFHPDWRSFNVHDMEDGKEKSKSEILRGPDAGLGMTEVHLSTTRATQVIRYQLPFESGKAGEAKHKELITAQQGLIMSIQEELQSTRFRARES